MPSSSLYTVAILATIATLDGYYAFVANTAPRPIKTTSLYSKNPSIGIFYGTSTGSTQEAADLISSEFGDVASEPIEIDEVQGSGKYTYHNYPYLIHMVFAIF